jgi:hypothetical protein
MSGLTEMLRRFGWTVPKGAEPLGAMACRRCKCEVLWVQFAHKKRPLDPNGAVHPMDCIGR